MNEIGEKIKEVRKRKGLSQEELADVAKVNLRTIQRIENNKNEPRGKTLHLICEALDLNAEDILNYGKKDDKNYLIYLHLSVISFLVIPLGNIILPLIIWVTKKDKIINLKEAGLNLLNFQILWTFITYVGLILFIILKMMQLNLGKLVFFHLLIFLWGVFNAINIILPILFSIRINSGKTKSLYPNIIKFIK
ncbi:helix-turn-helix domain-containing protein [Flavivirga sp. 57AJ16]|uniref:helix-turn-helix domain-containing protein n=1 Tax=Flavivirga sp. 57AJ16 TaxID=3025307 RepID=UPI002366E3BE|nr:helix-turn-helix domain-containing protein [Flavivirga sp. 57AJ16]MDD7887397.1 helix-turn-helix domain-containing protein [Flavivirga sp. 57AJ16]